jgi:putative hemolysin
MTFYPSFCFTEQVLPFERVNGVLTVVFMALSRRLPGQLGFADPHRTYCVTQGGQIPLSHLLRHDQKYFREGLDPTRFNRV